MIRPIRNSTESKNGKYRTVERTESAGPGIDDGVGNGYSCNEFCVLVKTVIRALKMYKK